MLNLQANNELEIDDLMPKMPYIKAEISHHPDKEVKMFFIHLLIGESRESAVTYTLWFSSPNHFYRAVPGKITWDNPDQQK